jgi:hypothetical protein
MFQSDLEKKQDVLEMQAQLEIILDQRWGIG